MDGCRRRSFFFFQAEDGIRDGHVTGVQTCALPIYLEQRVRALGDTGRVDAHTLFQIASNTKAFTTAALAILADEGKLSWDDPVTKFLPGFQLYDPYVTRDFTVRDLVTHRSGLGLGAGDLLWFHSNYNRGEIAHRIRFAKHVSAFRM